MKKWVLHLFIRQCHITVLVLRGIALCPFISWFSNSMGCTVFVLCYGIVLAWWRFELSEHF